MTLLAESDTIKGDYFTSLLILISFYSPFVPGLAIDFSLSDDEMSEGGTISAQLLPTTA